MKTLLTLFLTTLVFLLNISTAQALPIFPFVVTAFVITASNDTEIRHCYNESNVLVSLSDRNYNAEVTRCQANDNPDIMKIIKVL